jgi:transposase
MANKITEMSKIRQAIKLYCKGESKLFISKHLELSRNTVKKYISLYEVYGLSFEDMNSKTDAELDVLFSGGSPEHLSPKLQQLYDLFPQVHKALKKPSVTKMQLWEDYITKHPEGYRSSQFCHHYNVWAKRMNPVMHMEHKAGDKMYVDYSGDKLQIIDRPSGEIQELEFFVAILGASQYTFAECSFTQQTHDFINSLQNALSFYGGVPRAIVPDNLKAAVIKSSKFEPTINKTLQNMSEHYETTILPARAYKPRDKALVENAVRLLYQRIFSKIQKEEYFSLHEINERIQELLEAHNAKKLTARPYSRLELFNEIERAELAPLPLERFEIKYQAQCTVMQNGHILFGPDKHYYSVPYQYLRKKVTVLFTSSSLEIFFKYTRIASHPRNRKPYLYTTKDEHLASTHRFVADWDATRFITWAQSIDVNVGHYITKVIETRAHPEQAYKSCMGILAFEKKVGKERLIKACTIALEVQSYGYKIIQNILEKNLDMIQQETQLELDLPQHNNIRGKQYYN